MTSRFESLIYTEASHNSTCGRFSVFEAFRREAELIATLLAAGKMYLPDVFSSLLPPGNYTSEARYYDVTNPATITSLTPLL